MIHMSNVCYMDSNRNFHFQKSKIQSKLSRPQFIQGIQEMKKSINMKMQVYSLNNKELDQEGKVLGLKLEVGIEKKNRNMENT
jgi:hypothetical protein